MSFVKSPNKKIGDFKWWTTTKRHFLIWCIASQVEQGFKVDKGFRLQVFYVVTIIRDEFSVIITKVNVTNHLWTRIKKWRKLSGMG